MLHFFSDVFVREISQRVMFFVIPVLGWQQSPGRVALIVGANDGTEGNNIVVKSWLDLCSDKSACKRSNLSVLLVEPNPAAFQKLKRTVRTTYNNSPCITAVHALVSSSNRSTSFFRVNATRLRAVCTRPPHWAMFQLSSVDRSAVETQLSGFLKWASHRSGRGFQCDSNAIAAIGSYITEEQMTPTTVAALLSKRNMLLSDVDVFAVDTQGHDVEIVKNTLSQVEFFPRVVTFEHTMLHTDDLQDVLRLIESRGYATSCHRTARKRSCKLQSKSGRDQDVYATHTMRGLYSGVPTAPTK